MRYTGQDEERDEFDERLRRELQARYPSPVFPSADFQSAIENRIGRFASGRDGTAVVRVPLWVRPLRAVLMAAAAVVLFIGGMEYEQHRGSASSTMAPAAPSRADDRMLPMTIQSAGSRYVATVAEFGVASNRLTPAERAVAREVALAALYSAALELMREAENDDVLRAVTQLVAAQRQNVRMVSPANHSGS
jgi:hypothetical protein